ncbi:MAG: CPBP family intramembrane metalloprotease [Planctomycetaceae bacterium]|jgi:membrane protease YdiL (CAAX protease family)|nr:CPBP family intramembrane metalloprotease [Planctomycetaceae bacterium]
MKILAKDQIKPIVILLYAVLATTIWKYYAFPRFETEPTLADFWRGATPCFAALVLFGLIPMGIVKWIFREQLADYGLRLGIARRTLRTFAMAVPMIVGIAILTGHNAAFFDVYPLNATLRQQHTPISVHVFVIHTICYLGYYIGWEFLFRGFVQHGLSERCGIPTAVLIQTTVSAMLHYGHPASEVFAAVIAGLVWGCIAYRTRSLLSGFGQHALLGIVMDWVLVFGRLIPPP